jgi:hypothetical protein
MPFTRSLLLVALLAPCAAHAQAKAKSAPAAIQSDVGPARDSTTFVVGKRLYLRSSGTFIGTIIDVDENHDFRAGHFPRPWMKAVLLVRRDGPYEWTPVEGLSRLYYAK